MNDFEDASRAADLVMRAQLSAVSPSMLAEQVLGLWDEGQPPGDRTGWLSLDKHYTVMPGQMTVVTGWPGSGKSEWLDALLLNLAHQGWRFGIFSPENHPAETHVAKFVEKYLGKPFADGFTARATKEETSDALNEISEWFAFLLRSSDSDKEIFSIEDVLAAAEAHFRMEGIWRSKEIKRGLVIDPWNELEHVRPQHMAETEYISKTLSLVRSWARASSVHVWIVAHPQKLARDRESGKLPVPKPDSISGSQHWWNKCDNAVTVWRPLDEPMKKTVQIHVQKVRFKHIGRPGVVDLEYDRVTGRYHEPIPELLSVVK